MKFFAISAALSLASGTIASRCLSQYTATKIVNRYIGILNQEGSDLGDYLTTAKKLLTADYSETSDSILSLESKPLGGTTFASKAAFIQGISQAPPIEGLETLFVAPAACNSIIWQWQTPDIGTGEYPVKGFNLFTVTPYNKIKATAIEFNSIAWGQDTYQLPCGSAPSSSSTPEPTTTTTDGSETATTTTDAITSTIT